MICRCCRSTDVDQILDLGYQPWCNNFLEKEEISTEKTYPLELMYCNGCDMLQLSHIVPKETMFKNHTYVSSTTKTLRDHFLKLAIENKYSLSIGKDDLIIDIGGNDGTQLLQYKKIGLNEVLNIESADNIAKLSVKSGVKTLNMFFNEECVDNIIGHKKAKLINASGVFFHLEELHSVIHGIKKCLRDDGVFVVQFMYAGTMVDKLNFDTIYHEHLYYYTLKSLIGLLIPYGLEIFDAYHSDIHSGSIIAKFTHTGAKSRTNRCIEAIESDLKYTKEAFVKFAREVVSTRGDLRTFLQDLVSKGKTIYAFGAPAKGNTLLNYCGIDTSLVRKAVEINPLKIGKYLPGSHIPIELDTKDDRPDYYLLLSHNFLDEILKHNPESRFIVPFPKVRII
jgi:hypothetical protein